MVCKIGISGATLDRCSRFTFERLSLDNRRVKAELNKSNQTKPRHVPALLLIAARLVAVGAGATTEMVAMLVRLPRLDGR